MNVEILYRHSFSVARVRLPPGQSILAERRSMVAMSRDTQVTVGIHQGVLRAVTRATFGGEDFIINRLRAGDQGGEVLLAPTLPGDICAVAVGQGDAVTIQAGSFLAADESVTLDTVSGNLQTILASAGAVVLRCSGFGTVLMACYGVVHPIPIDAGQTFTVDSGHLLAFSQGIKLSVRPVGNMFASALSGEGLVVDVSGRGMVWVQSRSEEGLVSWLTPYLNRWRSNQAVSRRRK